MSSKIYFSSLIQTRKPVLAYNPPGILDPSLAVAVTKARGIGLIDLERLSSTESSQLLANCSRQMPDKWGVRVCTREQLSKVLELQDSNLALIIIGNDFPLEKEVLEELASRGIVLLAEVVSIKEVIPEIAPAKIVSLICLSSLIFSLYKQIPEWDNIITYLILSCQLISDSDGILFKK